MNKCLLAFLLLAAAATVTRADSPDAVLKDYRTRAAEATRRLDETLEKQGAAIIASLVSSGDTAGAAAATAQIKQLAAGDAVTAPHSAMAKLFEQYATARSTALQPVQAAAIARLDSLLKVAGGPKLDDLAALTKVRVEIEAGKVRGKVPERWTYHASETGPKAGSLVLRPDSTFELAIPRSSTPIATGTWRTSEKSNSLLLSFQKEEWIVILTGDTATIERPTIGVRWLRVDKGR